MTDATSAPTNVLIVGVGGQGVIMVSKVLAMLCQTQGYQVKQSEVHGMAKRGGAVFSHVRFGAQVWSPTIPAGEADILVALEWAEGLRWIDFMKPDTGTFIADCRRIVPPFACRNRRHGAEPAYAPQTPEEIMEKLPTGYALDATGMAGNLGNPKAANTVLLGALSTALDFPPEAWLEVLTQFVPPGTEETNRRAFLQGREWALAGDKRVAQATGARPAGRDAIRPGPVETTVGITEAWCKGCDICVKMCPERCLRLNERLIAELALPDLCTGCRLCELLCPDFAIRITNTPIMEAAC